MKKILGNKKGFTLMEVIVVLIILAVLMAALIPSLVGFVSDASAVQYINEARVGMMAAQALVTSAVAQGEDVDAFLDDGAYPTDDTSNPLFEQFRDRVRGDVTDPDGFSYITLLGPDSYRVSGIRYDAGNDWIVIIHNGNTYHNNGDGSEPDVTP